MTDLPPDDVQHDEVTTAQDAAVEDRSDARDEAREEELLAATEADIAARSPEPVETGHPAVDEVLRSLNTLDALPVDEHVAVFEQAHEELRRTLSGAGDDQG